MSEGENGRVLQINANPRGGVPKHRVGLIEIRTDGVGGDKQRDRRYHGGPKRAVSLYSWERLRELQDEGHPIDCGTTGENLTLFGIDWDKVAPGAILEIGEVELQITSYAAPCKTIMASFIDGKFKRISQKLHPGWSRVYARVLKEGIAYEGDAVILRDGSLQNKPLQDK
jgi:MOSC domain-containing protein YiiM